MLLLSCIALVLSVASASPSVNPPQFRGVNIGGWMELESWITPQFYADNGVKDGLGQWGFCSALGTEKATAVLTKFWDTWVTQDHLQKLKDVGVNWLRLPIGYWNVDVREGEPFPAPEASMFYIKRFMDWAGALGFNVLVDLHGAPGSQNGHDNSGRTGPINWNTPDNINRTIYDLGLIYQQLKSYPALAGIELLNEPWTHYVNGPIQISTLKTFFQNATDYLRGMGWQGPIVIADGWCDSCWDDFLMPPAYQNILIDMHIYRCFGQSSPTLYGNVATTCSSVKQRIQGLSSRDWSFTGEYSMCLDNTTVEFSSEWVRFASQYWAAQNTAYSGGPVKGSFFWNFRTENPNPMWNFLEGVAAGWAPQQPSDWNQDGCP